MCVCVCVCVYLLVPPALASLQIDGCWYRVRLQCPGEGGKWTVLFVDYGDVGTCLASELKEMRCVTTYVLQ